MKKTIKTVVSALAASVQHEINVPSLLAPYGTTAQLLTAFLCSKFDAPEALLTYERTLDPEIIERTAIPTHPTLLGKEDFAIIAENPNKNIDDYYNLMKMSHFFRSVPYGPDTPVSNGEAKCYDRAQDAFRQESFPDCSERTLGHFLSLLFFNKEAYTLDAIEAHIQKTDPTNPYYPKVRAFFTKHAPDAANASGLDVRSELNKILGDLNAFNTEATTAPWIQYAQTTNELEPDYVNFINVLQKLFSLPIPNYPGASVPLEEQQNWVATSLATVAKTLSPHRIYEFDTSRLHNTLNGLGGAMKILARNDKNEDLFATTLSVSAGQHASLEKIQDFEQARAPKATIEQLPFKKTTEDSLMLTVRQQVPHGLYHLFQRSLGDNIACLNFLENFRYSIVPFIQKALEHVIENISWGDRGVFSEACRVLTPLLREENEDLPFLKKVKTFEVPLDKVHSSFYVDSLENLETLLVSESDSEEQSRMCGLEKLTNLKSLKLYYNIPEPLPLATLSKLETLTVSMGSSGVYRAKIPYAFTGLEACTNLRHLCLSKTPIGKEFNLSTLSKLESLTIEEPTLRALHGCENLSNLHTLKLLQSGVEFLDLTGLKSLKSFSFDSKLKKLAAADFLKNLQTLWIQGRNKDLVLEVETFPYLENFTCQDDTAPLPHFASQMPNLRQLDVSSHATLETLDLKGLEKLERVSANNCPKLSSIIGVDTSPFLQSIEHRGANLRNIIERMPNGDIINHSNFYYACFSKSSADPNWQVDCIKQFGAQCTTPKFLNNLELCQKFLRTFLLKMNWNDAYQVREISPALLAIAQSQKFDEQLQTEVKGLDLSDIEINLADLQAFKALTTLTLTKVAGTPVLDLSFFPDLESLRIDGTSISHVSNLTAAHLLENFSAEQTHELKELNIGQMNRLLSVRLNGSKISKIIGATTAQILQEIDLTNVVLDEKIQLKKTVQLIPRDFTQVEWIE